MQSYLLSFNGAWNSGCIRGSDVIDVSFGSTVSPSNLLPLLHPLVLFKSNQNAKPGWTELARLTVKITGIIQIKRGSMIVQIE